MTKQEIMLDYAEFLIAVLERKAPERRPLDGALLDAYLYGYVFEYLRPDWFQSEKFSDAFWDMRNQLCNYRAKSGKDIFYAMIAKNAKLVTRDGPSDIYGDEDSEFHFEWDKGIIPVQDIGLIISNDSRDRKFIRRTIIQFLRRAFPRPKEQPLVFLTTNPKPTATEFLDRGCSIPGVGLLPKFSDPILSNSPINTLPLQDPLTEEKRAFICEMWRYICILMAETTYSNAIVPENLRWSYLEQDGDEMSREVDIDSLFARNAACLNPDAQACCFCRPEFRRLLSTIYYVRNSHLPVAPLYSKTSKERARYFELAAAVLSPIMDEMDGEIDYQIDVSGNALVEQQRLKEQLSKTEQEAKVLQAQLDELSKRTASPELMQELAKLKEELVSVKRKAEADLERTKADLAKLQAENKRLADNLSTSQTAFHEINEQYINLMEEQDFFLDDDDLQDQDAPPAPAGVRARIGEEAYEKLASKRLAVVGGHTNTQRVLRELFPDWRFFAVNEKLPDTLSAVDAVAVLARYTSHKNVEQARAAIKNSDIPMLMVNYNGPTSICDTLSKLV